MQSKYDYKVMNWLRDLLFGPEALLAQAADENVVAGLGLGGHEVAPDPDAFLAMLDGKGAHHWSLGIGDADTYSYGWDVAVAPGSRAWITGAAWSRSSMNADSSASRSRLS